MQNHQEAEHLDRRNHDDARRRPSWTQKAHRLDRPHVDIWYKPESGPLEGTLLWHGPQADTINGGTFHLFIVRDGVTGAHQGVRERAQLRGLRSAKLGSRVFIDPRGKKDIGDGKSMWEFDVMAEHLVDARPANAPEANEPAGPDKDGAEDDAGPTADDDGDVPF